MGELNGCKIVGGGGLPKKCADDLNISLRTATRHMQAINNTDYLGEVLVYENRRLGGKKPDTSREVW